MSNFTATLGNASRQAAPALLPPMPATLPPAPANPPPLKFNLRTFASYYVQRCLIQAFTSTPGGQDFMVDLLVSIRNTRGMYAEYLQRLGEVVIETDGALSLLTADARASLKPKQVNELADLIRSEAGIFNRDLKNTLRLLADAMSHASATMDAMDAKLDARIATYCQPETAARHD